MTAAGPGEPGGPSAARTDASRPVQDPAVLSRWRLVLGRYSEGRLPRPARGDDARMDAVLEQLYGREYAGRGGRDDDDAGRAPDAPREGGLGGSSPTLVTWLSELRELFPRETAEVVEGHALQRYGLTELVTDPQTLQRLEPSQELLTTLLMLRGRLSPDVLHLVRRIIAQVVEDIRRRLEQEVRQAMSGRLARTSHSVMPSAAAFDARGTIRANLANYDVESRRLVVDRALFFARNTRRLPWDVILCVDQSGSMASSVIHSAVMAGILSALPSLRVRLVLFDTSVVDLSEHVDDPVEVLLGVQLGGGTDIGRAVRYCEGLVENPHRTVLVLVTDFYEGAPLEPLLAAVARLVEARVTLLGLAALDGTAEPAHDRRTAATLAGLGMQVAALTPQQLARWLAGVVS